MDSKGGGVEDRVRVKEEAFKDESFSFSTDVLPQKAARKLGTFEFWITALPCARRVDTPSHTCRYHPLVGRL